MADDKQALLKQIQTLEQQVSQLKEDLKFEQVLIDILEISLTHPTLKEQLTEILKRVLAIDWLTLVKKGCIFIVEQPGHLSLFAEVNLSRPLLTICNKVKFGRCLCGKAAQTKEMIFKNCMDHDHENRFETMQPHGHYNLPIISKGEVVGVLNLYVEHGHVSTELERKFLKAVANVLAVVIEARKTEIIKDEMIAIISHELRTPLTSIHGALSLIKQHSGSQLDEQTKHLIEVSYNNSSRMSTMINDIINIERIASGNMPYDFKDINVNDCAKEAVFNNQGTSLSHDVQLTFTTADETDLYVLADHQRLQQVLNNLISNAIKFSSKHGVVRVSVSQLDDKRIQIEVHDEGSGIPEEFKSQIFSKFSQHFISSQNYKNGSGLGLYICKAIIEDFGGTIHFESEQNVGSSFYIILPRVDHE